MKELIKGRLNETLGYIIDQGSNRKEIHGRSGEFLGYYNRNTDATYNEQGAYVGKGEQLMRLLKD